MKKSDQVKLAELESRLYDIAQGAMGHSSFDSIGGQDGEGGMWATMGTEEWFRWVLAVRTIFGIAGEGSGVQSAPAGSVAFELWNLHYFAESIEEAAAHLFDFGARP